MELSLRHNKGKCIFYIINFVKDYQNLLRITYKLTF